VTAVDDQLDALWQEIRSLRSQRGLDERQAMLARLGAGPPSARVGVSPLDYPAFGVNQGAAYLGNASPLFGHTNLLRDPTLENLLAYAATGIDLTVFASSFAYWTQARTLNSGTMPTAFTLKGTISRTIRDTVGAEANIDNPLQTVLAEINGTWGTNACDLDWYLSSQTTAVTAASIISYIVAACRLISLLGTAPATGFTTATLALEVAVGTTGAFDVQSEVIDLTVAPPFQHQLVAADPTTSPGADLRWRLHLHLVKGAGAGATLAVTFGEPQLHRSFTADPPPFMPSIGHWSQGVLPDRLVLARVKTDAQITANQNDYGAGAAYAVISRLRLSTDASRTMTGLISSDLSNDRPVEGRLLFVENVGSFPLVLAHESASSAASNRFSCPGAVSFTITAGSVVTLLYDITDLRWRVLGGSSSTPSFASISSAVAIANTETQVVGLTIAAGTLTVGSTYRIRAAGVYTSGVTPGTGTWRIRIGTTTLTGNIACSVAPAQIASLTNAPFTFEALVTVRAIGAAGTIIGECWVGGAPASGANHSFSNGTIQVPIVGSATTATVAVDTTVAEILELTYISGNAGTTATFHVAIETVET